MIESNGLFWPDDTRTSQISHALRHRDQSLQSALRFCKRRGTAVQAGGNIGLWPRALSQCFDKVMTFEPEPVSMEALLANLRGIRNVEAIQAALGSEQGIACVSRKSLGSHKISETGAQCVVVTIDDLDLDGLDFLQLDVEGYELNSLRGAQKTIAKYLPVIQVELRNFGERYGAPDSAVRSFFQDLGYSRVAKTGGCDEVFVPADWSPK